jgi:hypothetical protein
MMLQTGSSSSHAILQMTAHAGMQIVIVSFYSNLLAVRLQLHRAKGTYIVGLSHCDLTLHRRPPL